MELRCGGGVTFTEKQLPTTKSASPQQSSTPPLFTVVKKVKVYSGVRVAAFG
jgi:hypothetical protein